MAFKVGDTVRLKSGGPIMTVESLNGTVSAFCSWFYNGKRLKEAFSTEALEKCESPKLGSDLDS